MVVYGYPRKSALEKVMGKRHFHQTPEHGPKTATDVHPVETERVEEVALVQVGLSQLALRLEQVTL